MRQKLTLFFGAGLAALVFPLCLQSDEPARLPYGLVYQIQKNQLKLSQTHTNLQIVLRMRSLLAQIKPADLRVYIDAKEGPTWIKLDSNGSFLVPMRPEWVEENPWIVANQPKGTMKLEWSVGVIGRRLTNGMPYRELMGPLQEVRAIAGELGPGGPKLTILGLKLIFSKEKQTMMVIRSKQGERVFKTGPDHALVIPLEAPLWEENPPIGLPDVPETIEVATRVNED